jgi:hypothetical protein
VICPFYCWGEEIVHRVSADTNRSWIREHMHKYANLLTNCGRNLVGQILPEGDRPITCIRCLGVDVREAAEDS